MTFSTPLIMEIVIKMSYAWEVDFVSTRTFGTHMKRIFCLLVIAVITSIGCNLATNTAATLTVRPTNTTQFFVTPTPRVFQATTTPILGAILSTALPGVTIPTPFPGSVPPATVTTETQNAIEWVISQVVIPAWNFLYTLIINGAVSLWTYAGDRGGLTAQVCGCLLPVIVGGFLIVRSTLRRIRLI